MKINLFTLSAAITLTAMINSTILIAQNTSPYWSLAGNSNAATTSRLGTTNGISLRFYTNNIQRMIINSAAGYVGIGTTTPVNILTVKVSGSTPAASWLSGGSSPVFMGFAENMSTGFNLATAGNSFNLRPVLNTRRSRGTLASPSVVLNNDYLASFVASGYDGSNFQNPAGIDFYVDGTPSSGSLPARISFLTGTNVSNRTERLRIGSTGDFNFNNDRVFIRSDGIVGIRTLNLLPTYRLQVAGLVGGIMAITDEGIGVFGEGDVGIWGNGCNKGFTGAGVYGNGCFAGVQGYSDLNYGIYGSTGENASYAAYFDGDVYSSGSYNASDRILKKDITNMESAMDLIKKLQPKSYTFRQDGNYKLMNLPAGKHFGLIAQDVEQVLPGLVKASTFQPSIAGIRAKQKAAATPVKSSALSSSETISFKALNYTELIPIMISGMQEIDAENKALKEQNNAVKQELTELREMIVDLKNGRIGSAVTGAFLEQNNPNPVEGNTTVRYQVPVTTISAKITITNAKGQLIKAITISNKGAGQLNFNAAALPAGTYNYSLWVDGKQADTKALIIAR